VKLLLVQFFFGLSRSRRAKIVSPELGNGSTTQPQVSPIAASHSMFFLYRPNQAYAGGVPLGGDTE
jgi:hypothetical protein